MQSFIHLRNNSADTLLSICCQTLHDKVQQESRTEKCEEKQQT